MVKICLVTDNLKVCVLSCIIFLNFFLLVLDWCCNHLVLVLFICVYGLDTLVHSNQMSRHQTATLKYTKKNRLICGLPLYTRGAQPAAHVAHNAILVTETIWLQKSLSVSGGCSHLFYMEKLGIKWQTDWIILMVHCVVISEARMGLSWTQHGSPVKSRSDGEVAMHKCGYIHCSGWMLWNASSTHIYCNRESHMHSFPFLSENGGDRWESWKWSQHLSDIYGIYFWYAINVSVSQTVITP